MNHATVTSPINLVDFVDRRFVSLIRSDGATCRSLVRLPLSPDRKGLFGGVFSRLVRQNRPRRVLLTIAAGTPYGEVMDPGLTVLEQFCDESSVPLLWLPDLFTLLEALRGFGSQTSRKPRADAALEHHGIDSLICVATPQSRGSCGESVHRYHALHSRGRVRRPAWNAPLPPRRLFAAEDSFGRRPRAPVRPVHADAARRVHPNPVGPLPPSHQGGGAPELGRKGTGVARWESKTESTAFVEFAADQVRARLVPTGTRQSTRALASVLAERFPETWRLTIEATPAPGAQWVPALAFARRARSDREVYWRGAFLALGAALLASGQASAQASDPHTV